MGIKFSMGIIVNTVSSTDMNHSVHLIDSVEVLNSLQCELALSDRQLLGNTIYSWDCRVLIDWLAIWTGSGELPNYLGTRSLS